MLTRYLRKLGTAFPVGYVEQEEYSVDARHDGAINLLWPLDLSLWVNIKVFEVKLKQHYGECDIVNLDPGGGRVWTRYPRQRQGSMNEMGLAHAIGTDDRNVDFLHDHLRFLVYSCDLASGS